ncbi:MAG: protein polymerase [Fibrobacteres bacterium]|nr:protein polymerase [Fibrobacterota bacterium]
MPKAKNGNARRENGPANAEIASMLREMALRLEMQEIPFKPQAFEKAAHTVDALDESLEKIHREGGLKALDALPAVGAGIAKRIEEALATGRIGELEDMRRETPVDIVRLSAVEGLGPKSIRVLHDQLGIRTLDDLARAARAGAIRGLPGFGAKTEAKLIRGIEFLGVDAGRLPLGEAFALAHRIEINLRVEGAVRELVFAGSLRRRKETIGDIDILAVTDHPVELVEQFVSMPGVSAVYARGVTKALVRLSAGVDADLRVVPRESLGAALVYFTGNKDHTVAIRRLALERGLKINEYGVFRGKSRIAGETEESVYAAVGLPWIPPELREYRGEIEAAREGRLPRLVEQGDLLGDLQIQTDWTDGADSLEAIVEAARRMGRKYIAITDHTRDLPMARGNDEERLLLEAEAIRALDRRMRGIRVLAGAELNIRRDGSVDIADEVLAKLDVVGAGIHSHFNLPREEMTRRMIRAMENPNVDILFHPSARHLGRRKAVDFDTEAVFAAARRTGTVLEIDAQPGRLDLKDEHIRRAVEMGVKLVISSDAHSAAELRYPEIFGIGLARRGWAEKKDILNTLPVEKFLKRLKGSKTGRRAPA